MDIVAAETGEIDMTDDDDAPEWSKEVFDRAEIKKGGKVIRGATGTLTAPTTPRVSVPVEPMTVEQREMLEYLATVEGADVWERRPACICRALEALKFVRIVKAKTAPKDGAARQPYFGVKIARAGMKAIGRD